MNARRDHCFEIVSAEGLESELSLVCAATGDSLAGIFGPRSMTWRVDREAAVFLGAGRALLLQLAHPWVATAIEQHSDTFADPISRFHRTFSVVFTMVFGRLEQNRACCSLPVHRHQPFRLLRQDYTPTHRRLGRNSLCFSVCRILLGA
jgi:hypothetical protein